MNLPSVMKHDFSRSPQAEIPRSSFDRTHGYKTTFDAGYLVPVFVDEALPGDTFNCDMTAFARLATPIYPVMDNMFLDSFFFAVPLRLLWDNFERFQGAQDDPEDSTDFQIPQMVSPASTGYAAGTLSDYFGIPTEIPDLTHSSLWHRAYNLIYNDWFRDENLQDSLVVDRDDGPDDPADYVIKRRGKRHDYFTSCLPWPQKGSAVTLPLGTTAPVVSNNNATTFIPTTGGSDRNFQALMTSNQTIVGGAALPSNIILKFGTESGLEADLTSATAATINELREAFQYQRLYERDARGGTRYKEIILSHFGVHSDDARLDRPEYLGGGSAPVNINPVAQTSATSGSNALGDLAGFGTSVIHRHGFTKTFKEHCVLIGLVNVRADLNYQQGLNRMFSRLDRFDFYFPALSHLGEQAVLNKEIYAQGSLAATDDNVFGYQEAWADYRYKPSLVTGEFRSNFSTPLDAWHLAQDFSALPSLNASFIEDTPPMDRIKAVTSEPDFIFDSIFNLKCARPMPLYSVPGLIDHF